MELTIGITAHNENLLAHKTMLSLFRALANMDNYEIIVHIDNGSSETKEYFSRYKEDTRFTILENDFRDLGEARNEIIKHAKGKYVIFVDADDLVSENYFSEILAKLKSTTEEIFVHPDQSLCFWEDYPDHALLWPSYRPSSHTDATLALLSRNRWPSSAGGSRELFKKHPYIKAGKGFGHEDYILNIELTNANIKHVVAEGTVLFYRQKNSSYMRDNNAQQVTQPYTPLFDIKAWQKIDYTLVDKNQKVKTIQQATIKERTLSLYVKARNNQIINTFVSPVAKVAKKLTGKKLVQPNVPEWILTEWKKLSNIEIQMYPTPWILDNLKHVSLDADWDITKAYYQLCQPIKDYPDYIFIVPWLIAGGADKVVLNYVKALLEIHPRWKIAVVSTVQGENNWANRLPDNAFFIDFGNASSKMRPEAKDRLFTRLMIQMKCPNIHIINSLYGYQWVDSHRELIRHHFKLNLSLFCHDIVPNTDGKGHFDYADPYVLRIYPLVNKIYTDNEAVVEKLINNYGLDRKKLKVHYQPTKPSRHRRRGYDDADLHSKKLNILWASRLASQKNPHLLIRIAKKLDSKKAHIDVFGRRCPDCAHLFFPLTKAIRYHGAFNQLDSLDLDKYDLLLYTSHIDGVPNIILESASAGLPILASSVGGVADFIQDGETGFLVEDYENEDKYIEIINQLYEDKTPLRAISDKALELVNSRHSWEAFLECIKEDF